MKTIRIENIQNGNLNIQVFPSPDNDNISLSINITLIFLILKDVKKGRPFELLIPDYVADIYFCQTLNCNPREFKFGANADLKAGSSIQRKIQFKILGKSTSLYGFKFPIELKYSEQLPNNYEKQEILNFTILP